MPRGVDYNVEDDDDDKDGDEDVAQQREGKRQAANGDGNGNGGKANHVIGFNAQVVFGFVYFFVFIALRGCSSVAVAA